MKQKFFFRVDGGLKTGLGHVVRCIALSQMLDQHYSSVFLCKEIPESLAEELALKQIEVYRLKDDDELFQYVEKDSIVLLDGYPFDISYQKAIKEFGCKLICIDDLFDKPFYADLIINHVPGVKPENYVAQEYTRYALGPDFALLRKPFIEAAGEKHVRQNNFDTALICFGGSDEYNLTLRTLEETLNFPFEKINVVTGAAYIHQPSIKAMTDQHATIRHFHAIDEYLMADLMKESDMVIVPASSLLYEAIAVGCNIISGISVANQEWFYKNFLSFNAFVTAYDFDRLSIKNAISQMICSNGEEHRATLIDGKSGERFLALINSL